MVVDICTFARKIQEGVIANNERTRAARIAYVDKLSAHSKELFKYLKWYQNFRNRKNFTVQIPHMLSENGGTRVTEG